MGKVESLKEEVNKLKQEKAAFQAQSRLLENFVSLAKSPGKETTLNTILQQTLEISAQITGAEKGSLFLLDSNEIVTDSILTRGKTSSRKRTKIIGKILRKDLPDHHAHQIAVIHDEDHLSHGAAPSFDST